MKLEPFVIQQRVSYHADFYVPDEPLSKNLLICLHGYGQSKEVAMKFGQAIRKDWPIAALQAPYPHFKRQDGRFETGFSWVSSFNSEEAIHNHHQFIIQVIEQAHAKHIILEKKAVIFGFSQSMSLNYRFAAKHPEYVKGIIAVAGAAPSDWPADTAHASLNMPVLHIAPTEDDAYPIERAHEFKTKLERHCKQLTWHEEPGGHRVPKASYKIMRDWLERLT